MRSVNAHSQRLERWLGRERIESLSRNFVGWYGPSVPLLDVPGSVRVNGDGDFSGPFERGYLMSAADALWEAYKRAARQPYGRLNVGFTSVSDSLAQASSGNTQYPGGNIMKIGSTGVVGISNTLWRVGAMPIGGAQPAIDGSGVACTSSTVGAMQFTNPASANLRLVGADIGSTSGGNTLMIYDRLWHVGKTMNSSGAEAVNTNNLPTRYTNTVTTAEDYIGGNFLSIEVGGTPLAGTNHNWTVCQYTNQAATTGQTLPSVTGVNAAITDRMDSNANSWFCPLASGDTGIKNLTQMQCSALVATGIINFMIGHPLGIMAFANANNFLPYDWITNRNQAPRIYNSACLALLELSKSVTSASVYSGRIYATAAAQ